ncbi:hypothetical protein Bbelb_038290 [Branchiostoma belcheri]|nr:hypothetical protein Bbelb_038290 [Branchiostoma belcheri]
MANMNRCEPVINIEGLSPSDYRATADEITKTLCAVIQSLSPLDTSLLPAYLPAHPAPNVKPWEVYQKLQQKVKTKKAPGPDGIPAKPTKLVPCKVAESFVAEWAVSDIAPEVDPQQSGCLKGRSTTHCLLDLTHELYIFKAKDQPGTLCSLVSTDFSKAFDRVSHNIAIYRLIELGLRPSLVRWISDFLTNRTQVVRYHGALYGNLWSSTGNHSRAPDLYRVYKQRITASIIQEMEICGRPKSAGHTSSFNTNVILTTGPD